MHPDPASERAALLLLPKRQASVSLQMPTTGRLVLTIAAVRGIAPEDVNRGNDPLWLYLRRFSTIYVDAACVRFLAGCYTSGLAVEEAIEEIIGNLEEEAFGIAL